MTSTVLHKQESTFVKRSPVPVNLFYCDHFCATKDMLHDCFMFRLIALVGCFAPDYDVWFLKLFYCLFLGRLLSEQEIGPGLLYIPNGRRM